MLIKCGLPPNKKLRTKKKKISFYHSSVTFTWKSNGSLSSVMDLYNQEIVSYELSESPNFKSVMTMLDKALKKTRITQSLLLHSDQGWQYQMKQYQHLLQQSGITQSMSRKGNCLDNAVMENFFGIVKSELFSLKKYDSVFQLKKEIAEYIRYYNNDRIKLNLNGMSPIQYRAHYLKN